MTALDVVIYLALSVLALAIVAVVAIGDVRRPKTRRLNKPWRMNGEDAEL